MSAEIIPLRKDQINALVQSMNVLASSLLQITDIPFAIPEEIGEREYSAITRANAVSDKLIRGIATHGFGNDDYAVRALRGLRTVIAKTIMHDILENESAKTNPSKSKAESQSDKSEATLRKLDRGELVEVIRPYLTMNPGWSAEELPDLLADAIMRNFKEQQS